MAESPEVFLVHARMERTGVDVCLDVHGDEALPYVFIAGPEGVPSFSAPLARRPKLGNDELPAGIGFGRQLCIAAYSVGRVGRAHRGKRVRLYRLAAPSQRHSHRRMGVCRPARPRAPR